MPGEGVVAVDVDGNIGYWLVHGAEGNGAGARVGPFAGVLRVGEAAGAEGCGIAAGASADRCRAWVAGRYAAVACHCY